MHSSSSTKLCLSSGNIIKLTKVCVCIVCVCCVCMCVHVREYLCVYRVFVCAVCLGGSTYIFHTPLKTAAVFVSCRFADYGGSFKQNTQCLHPFPGDGNVECARPRCYISSHCQSLWNDLPGTKYLGTFPLCTLLATRLPDTISLTKMNCTLSSTSSLRYMFMKQERHCGVPWSRILTESQKNGLRCSHSLSKAKLRLRKTWSRSLRKSVTSALHGSKGMCTSALHG